MRSIVNGCLAMGCVAGCLAGPDDAALGVSTDAVTAANFSFDALQFTGGPYAQTSEVVSTAVDNVTLEVWVRRDGGPGAIIAYNGNSSSSGFGLYAASDGRVKVLVGGKGWVECDGCNLPIGRWTHIAVERVAGLWRFIQNGASLNAASDGASLAPNPPVGQLAIGAAPGGSNPLTGAIDEVRYWDTGLSPQVIEANMAVALDGDEPGLVAYYRLDDGDGGSAIDAAPGHRRLMLRDHPVWISSGATLSTGIARDALELVGTAYGHTSTVVTQRVDGVTFEGWFRWDGGDAPAALIYNGDSSANGYGLYVTRGAVSLRAGLGSLACAGCRMVPGVWTHLAAVRSATTWQVFQDGVLRLGVASPVPVPPAGVLSIAGSTTGGELLIGAVDEVRIWGVARTPRDIADGYTLSLSGTEPDLLAYYRMDDASGSVATDSAGSHPLTLVNAPIWFTSGALLATAQR